MIGNIQKVSKRLPTGKQVSLDLTDAAVFDFVRESYDRAGLGHERCPGLHEVFQMLHASRMKASRPAPSPMAMALLDDGWQTGAQVSGIGKNDSGDVASAGFVTFVGGVNTCLSVIQVVNPNDNNPETNLLATGQSSGFGQVGTLPMLTQPAGAKPPTDQALVNILYTYQKEVGGPLDVVNYQVPYSSLANFNAPTVTQPTTTIAHASNPMIKIGLGRGPIGQDKADVDYWFWQGTSDTTYAVPFVGTVDFAADIRTPLVTGTTFFPDFTLTRKDGGYKKLSGADLTNAIAGFSASGKTLTWSLPATDDPNTTKPIIFGALDWQVESNVYFSAQFPVTLTNNTLGYAAVVSSDTQPPTTQGITYIKPIWLVYHCVLPGTLITLADGTNLPIEQITSAHAVRIDDRGVSLAVRGNSVARHTGPVFRLTTKRGRDLVMSYGHLVITAHSGPVAAQDLRSGDRIQTLDGSDEIAAIATEAYRGPLFNVEINDPRSDSGNTLYANGIRVGDMRMQADHHRRQNRCLKTLLSKVDPIFHQDCLNHLALNP